MRFKAVRRIVVGLLVAGTALAAAPLVLVFAGKAAYDNHDYAGAQNTWRLAQYVSLYDRDVILFDIGDAQYQARDFASAATTSEEASRIAADDRYCMIIFNWGRSLADHAATLESHDKSGALTIYADALRAISVQRCTDSPAYRDTFEELRQEILKKIAELTAAPQPQKQQQSSGEESADEILGDHSGEAAQQRKYQSAVNHDRDPITTTRNYKLVR